jgi:hypothetical protein
MRMTAAAYRPRSETRYELEHSFSRPRELARKSIAQQFESAAYEFVLVDFTIRPWGNGWRCNARDWDRSAKWSQFRSPGRQHCELMYRTRRDRRIRRRRSAHCEKRGVKSSQEFGVVKPGTDGSARRSRWLSPAWWTGPPPIPRRGPPRATNRMTRPPRRSHPQEAARGFWIRAWG